MSLRSIIKKRRLNEKHRLQIAAEGLLKLSKTKNSPTRYPEKSFNTFFFPKKDFVADTYSFNNSFNTGTINVFCSLQSVGHSLICFDHGQYPWGRHREIGIMATICRNLQISNRARNTCLPLHIIVGLLLHEIISLRDILHLHPKFIRNMLSSRHTRESTSTINAFIRKFNLSKKVCFRTIVGCPIKILCF